MTSVFKNIYYSDSGIENVQNDKKCTVDIYVPTGSNNTNKISCSTILIYFHGGAWRSGDKSEYAKLGEDLSAKTKCVVAVANYRLSLKETNSDRESDWLFPKHLLDVEQAICKVVDFGTEQGLYVPENIYLIGHSAGAMLASMITLMNNSDYKYLKQREFFSRKLKGCIGVAGVYNIPKLVEMNPEYIDFVEQAFGINISNWEKGSSSLLGNKNEMVSLNKVNADTKLKNNDLSFKFVVVHGKEDELVNLIQATELAEKLKTEGIPVSLQYLENGNHFDMLHTEEFINLINKNIT